MNLLVTTLFVVLELFLHLSFIPSKVLAIDCYQCQSNVDIECSEKFDQDYTKLRAEPCGDVFEARYCIKSTGMFAGEIGTKRFCSSRDYGDYCDYVRRPGDERDYRSCIFTCSSDGCNHSSSLTVSHISSIALISFAFLYTNLKY